MRTNLFLLGTILSGLLLASCAPEDDFDEDEDTDGLADAVKTNGPIKVVTDKQGTRFTDWGFDIKQSCKIDADPCIPPVARNLAENPTWPTEIFGSGKMNVLRIPLRADRKGVDANGNFKADYYELIVKAAKKALAVNPNIRIFASRNTISDCDKGDPRCNDFDSSLKDGGKPSGEVLMWKYGRLMAQYLAWFDSQGVRVDILGPDNEPTNNEGNLTVARMANAIESLDQNYDRARPKLMLNDGSKPDIAFLQAIDAANRWNLVGFAGTHYQSDERATRHDLLDQFAAFAKSRGNKEVWDTEYHFTDNKAGDDKPGILGEYADAALGVFGIFDQLDAGFSGIVWWGYKPPSDGTSKSEIQTELVETIGGSFPLVTHDRDGDASTRSSLNTRAVHQGKDVVVWVVNDTDNGFSDMPIVLIKNTDKQIKVKSVPTFVRWKRVDATSGAMERSAGSATIAKGDVVLNYPKHSITAVRIPNVY